jgi:hypothetical protein
MVDVILQTPNLDVFGGPTSIDVSTDFGKPGIRGPIFWVGDKSPDVFFSVNQLSQVNINDFFISTSPDPEFYGWLYKRVPAIGAAGARWEKILSLDPQQYSSKELVEFDVNGIGTLDIPLTKITTDSPSIISFIDRFIIRNSFENAAGNPVASSFTFSIHQNTNLRIVINAVAFNGTDWVKLVGTHKVHNFVSYLA